MFNENLNRLKSGPEAIENFAKLLSLTGQMDSSVRYRIVSIQWFPVFLDIKIEQTDGTRASIYISPASESECFVRSSHTNISYNGPEADTKTKSALDRIAVNLRGITFEKLVYLLISDPETAVDTKVELIKGNDKKILLKFHVNSECGWNCAFCDIEEDGNEDHIDLGKIIDSILKKHNEENSDLKFLLTGKDPLHNKHIIEYLNILDRYDSPIVIQTPNSMIVDRVFKEQISTIQSDIVFEIPLYGANESTHNGITRVEGSYGIIMKAINEKHFNLCVRSLFLRDNIDQLNYIENMCTTMDVDFRVNMLFYNEWRKHFQKYSRNAVRLSDVLKAVSRFSKKFNPDAFIRNNYRSIPLCMAEKFVHKDCLEEILSGIVRIPAPSSENHSPCPNQNKCRYKDLCIGIYYGYTELFGTSEFVPVK